MNRYSDTIDSLKTTLRILFILIVLASVALFFYWLWQRQPKETQKKPETKISQDEIIKSEGENITIKTIPEDGTVVDDTILPLTIKTSAQNYLAIAATSDATVLKSDESGQAKADLKLAEGLNFVKITAFSRDFKKSVDSQISIYLKPAKKIVDAKIVAAGSIKNTFEDVVTLVTSNAEKKIKTKGAKIASPSPVSKNKSPREPEQKFRVGDFLLVLGNESSGDQIDAKSVEIYRENKPQLAKEVYLVKILSKVKGNNFSTKVEKDNKIEDFDLSKDSQISKDSQKGSPDDIQKDKKAIIVSHALDNKKIVDLIYLLP